MKSQSRPKHTKGYRPIGEEEGEEQEEEEMQDPHCYLKRFR
jgi:hypothetical protein